MSKASASTATSNTASLMPSSAARGRPPRLPFDHGEAIWRCRYDVVAAVLFAVAGALLWATYQNPTHAVNVDLPGPSFLQPEWDAPPPADEPANIVSITSSDVIEWNGEPVDYPLLLANLQDQLNQPIEPRTVFSPAPDASYDSASKVIAVIRMSGVTKLCFAYLPEYLDFTDGDGLRRFIGTRSDRERTVKRSAAIDEITQYCPS